MNPWEMPGKGGEKHESRKTWQGLGRGKRDFVYLRRSVERVSAERGHAFLVGEL